MSICLRRREFITLLGGAAAWPLAARAQQRDRVRRIGVLMPLDENDPVWKPRLSAFTQALPDLGWTEGRNARMDLRWAGDDTNRIRALAQELVGQQPDIILAFGPAATVALQRGCRKLKKPHKMRVSESSVLKSIKNRRARDRRGGVAGRGRYPVTARRRAPLASSPVIVLAHQLLDHVQQGNVRLGQCVHGGERRADDVAVLAMAGAGRMTIGSTFLAGFGLWRGRCLRQPLALSPAALALGRRQRPVTDERARHGCKCLPNVYTPTPGAPQEFPERLRNPHGMGIT